MTDEFDLQQTLINATELARTMYGAIDTSTLPSYDLVVATSILFVATATAVGLDKAKAVDLIGTCPIWDADPKEFLS